MRICKKCNVKLVIGDNWRESNKKSSTYKCNDCIRAYLNKWMNTNRDKMNSYTAKWRDKPGVREELNSKSRKYKQDIKDGLHYVYLLIKDNYVGVTNSPRRRAWEQTSQNRDSKNMRLLYSTPDRAEAFELEALLHDMGYEGRNEYDRN